MCGIAGYIRRSGLLDDNVARTMLEKIRHRGPDGEAVWYSPPDGLALVHSRLKVQDLTPAADQPMHSADGAVTLIYNGEIYNFPELREELRARGATFRSTGDTEVLLELCRRHPDLSFLPRLNGMFAFAAWYPRTKTLYLVRDRAGVKPLLFASLPDRLIFGSEMASLRPALTATTIDPSAVMQLIVLGFIAAPQTVFHEVRKLRPGHWLRFRDGAVEIKRWAETPPPQPAPADLEHACEELRARVRDAVRVRLLADVPLGVFLSGGIDSAVVTAAASREAGSPVNTFSVGFPEEHYYDETEYARAVAGMHGTQHTVLPLTLRDVQEVIPAVQAHLGEPFADSSALPTYLLSKLTRRHVTVALSGDGADELFAGYNRYAAATLIRRFGWLARTPLYGPVRGLVERLPAKRERRLGGIFSQLKRAIRSLDPRLPHRYAYWMRICDDRTLARLLDSPGRAQRVSDDVAALLWASRPEPRDDDDLNHHLRVEWQLSLPDDMLTKVDLMSMAHGLEVRSPFLDYRLAERVLSWPAAWKLRGWKKKYLLIEAFRHDLPPLLHHRPKKGFEVPVGPWLRGPLYGWARELIAADRCFFGDLLSRPGAIQTLEEHTAGRADHSFCLWSLLSLLAWQQGHAPAATVAPL